MHAAQRTVSSEAIGVLLLTLAGLGLIAYATWFIIDNFVDFLEIGLSPADVGVTKEQILAFSPGVYDYISHVQVALGGFMASTGFAITLMAWYGVRRREEWAWWGTVFTSIIWVIIALPLHYAYGFSTLSHLGVVYLFLATIAIGGYLARPWR